MAASDPTKPLDIYIRVSAVAGREGDTFQSPPDQEARCRAQLEADGLKAGKVYTDLDQSGGKMSRPEFDKVMERIESGTSGGVVVARLDRLGRNTLGVLDAVKRIEDAGGSVIAVREKLDTSTSTGRFVLTLFAALGELELDRYRETFDAATANYLARGGHGGTSLPPGYDRDETPGHVGRLVPNADAPAVCEAFLMRGRGESLEAIAQFLREKDVPLNRPVKSEAKHTRDFAPHTDWTGNRVRQMLKNAVYLGVASARGQTRQGAHEALVTRAVWNKAQTTRSRTRTNTTGEGALLAGIVVCGSCGRPMTSDSERYRCSPRGRKEQPCDRPVTIARKLIDPLVEDEALGLLNERRPTYKLKLGGNAGGNDLADKVAGAERELAEYLRLVPATTLGFADGLAARDDALATAREERDSATDDDDRIIVRLLTADRLRNAFDVMTVPERRSVIGRVIARVVIRPGAAQPHDRLEIFPKLVHPRDRGEKRRPAGTEIAQPS